MRLRTICCVVFQCIFWVIASTEAVAYATTIPLPPPIMLLSAPLPEAINGIQTAGSMLVDIKQLQTAQPDYYEITNSGDFTIHVGMENNILHLTTVLLPGIKPDPKHVNPSPPPHVVIGVHNLTHLIIHDASSIIATNLSTSDLSILVANQSHLDLQGNIGLHDLTVLAPGEVTIHGINSQQLHIHDPGGANILLTGSAQYVQARVSGVGTVNTFGLHNFETSVQTEDQSQYIAGVVPRLRGFASGNSFILVYSRPSMTVLSTYGSGNILFLSPSGY